MAEDTFRKSSGCACSNIPSLGIYQDWEGERSPDPPLVGSCPQPRHTLQNRSGCHYKHVTTAGLLGLLHNTDTQEPENTLPKAVNLWETDLQ